MNNPQKEFVRQASALLDGLREHGPFQNIGFILVGMCAEPEEGDSHNSCIATSFDFPITKAILANICDETFKDEETVQ